MEVVFLLRGLVFGFSIAAPVGPIGVLCIRRTLVEGRACGVASGLGAATADAVFGCVAAFGLTFVSALLVNQEVWLRVSGAAFLCYIGLQTIRAKPAGSAAAVRGRGLLSSYASTFLLTITNPMTIMSFTAIFAGLGLAVESTTYRSATALVLGVFAGSVLWWLLLTTAVDWVRTRVDAHALTWINRVSGFLIAGFGLVALLSLA